MQVKVCIAGSSHIRRLEQFTRNSHNNFTANLNLDGNELSTYWHGIGGRTIDKFRKFDLDNIFYFKPDIVYLQLGGGGAMI